MIEDKELVMFDQVVKFDLKKIILNLTCYLCKGIYRNPHTFNECCDTFCKACIYKFYIKNKKNEKCPKCLKPIGGRPLDSLIFDNTLNTLINIIFPEFEKQENELNETLEKILRVDDNFMSGMGTISKPIFNETANIDYSDCSLIYLECDETFEKNYKTFSFPGIYIPLDFNTIDCKRFIMKYFPEIENESEIVLLFNEFIISEEVSFGELKAFYGLGTQEKTIIKFTFKKFLMTDY